MAARETSALYIAELQCRKGDHDGAIAALRLLPAIGGDIRIVQVLIDSVRHAGHENCARDIEVWFQAEKNG